MDAFRNSRDPWKTDLGPRGRIGSAVVLLGVLLVLMTTLSGCSVLRQLTTVAPDDVPAETTTSVLQGSATTLADAPAILADATTSTLADEPAAAPVDSTTTTVPDTTTTSTTTDAESIPTTTATYVEPLPDTQDPTGTTQPEDALPEDEVLYEISDWSSGVSGWAAAGQWKTVDGMLVTDGTSDSFAVAPVDLTGYPDYVVECEVQIVDPTDETVVLLMARMINGTAYYGGFDGSISRMAVGYDASEIASVGFVLDSEWHKHRLEVRGNTMKLYLEQAEVARAVDNRAVDPGTVGIYCGSGQINVRSFRVVAL